MQFSLRTLLIASLLAPPLAAWGCQQWLAWREREAARRMIYPTPLPDCALPPEPLETTQDPETSSE